MSQMCEPAPSPQRLDLAVSGALEHTRAQAWPPDDGHEEVSTFPLPLPIILLPPSYPLYSILSCLLSSPPNSSC